MTLLLVLLLDDGRLCSSRRAFRRAMRSSLDRSCCSFSVSWQARSLHSSCRLDCWACRVFLAAAQAAFWRVYSFSACCRSDRVSRCCCVWQRQGCQAAWRQWRAAAQRAVVHSEGQHQMQPTSRTPLEHCWAHRRFYFCVFCPTPFSWWLLHTSRCTMHTASVPTTTQPSPLLSSHVAACCNSASQNKLWSGVCRPLYCQQRLQTRCWAWAPSDVWAPACRSVPSACATHMCALALAAGAKWSWAAPRTACSGLRLFANVAGVHI